MSTSLGGDIVEDVRIRELDTVYSQIDDPLLIRNLLTFNQSYWRAGMYRKEKHEYTRCLVDKKGVFLSGFIDRIARTFSNTHNIIVDRINLETPTPIEPCLPGITLRDDQLRQIKVALERKRGVLVAPTGTGKTVLMAGLISCFPESRVLYLVHTIDLVNQTIAEFERFGLGSISKMGDGSKDLSGRIVVSTVQSFAKLDPRDYCDMFTIAFLDECFAKGTKIKTPKGDTLIENIKVGDEVFNKDGLTHVKNVFVNKVKLDDVVKITLHNHTEIVCSKNHLFYVDGEWIEAKNLRGKNLFAFPKTYGSVMSNIIEPERRSKNEAEENKFLFDLWRDVCNWMSQESEKNLLKERVSEHSLLSNSFQNKQEVRIGEDEEKQPVLQSPYHCKDDRDKKNKWNPSCLPQCSWWEWLRGSYTSNAFSSCLGLGNGVCCQDTSKAWEWIPPSLQDRRGKSNFKNWNRGGWKFPLFQKRKGSEEAKPSAGFGVENIEVYKQGSVGGSFKSVVGDKERDQGYIEFYDLEIVGHPSYFANGVLVHNCHHAATFNKGSFYKVLSTLLVPIKFGVTATLPTNEETRLVLEGLVGEVVDEMTFKEATDLGILAVPKIKLIKVEPYSQYDVTKYSDIYEEAIVNNRPRNRQILMAIKELNKEGLSTVTYVQRKDHIAKLMEMSKYPAINVDLHSVQGDVDGDERVILKQDLHEKKIMNVVATVVWREGVNIKSLNAIIIAGGGKNEKDLIQACGRGARIDEGKNEFVIVDFVDEARYLSNHFCARLGVYIKKGWI
jgi:superfamily II DNA or RNA helicase